jgi:hypothetical protein
MSRVLPSQAIQVIDRLAPYGHNYGGPHPQLGYADVDAVSGILAVIDEIPIELLGTLDGNAFADLTSRKAIARNFIQRILDVNARGNVSAEHIVAIRQLIERCPDAIPSPATAALAFVTDPDLKESLRLDISSANHHLAYGEWKSATVLAASVVESLLLWALNLRNPADIATATGALAARPVPFRCPALPLDDPGWRLRPYIEVAAELHMIVERTAIQARQAAEYRNLIHPGRAQRLAQQCSRGTALAAVSALELVVTDLTP